MVAGMKTFRLERSIPIEEGYDVVVAGGGPAGAAAAICAGRLGAKVLLIEATGCLGGMGTSGFVTAFDPMANGKESLVGGFNPASYPIVSGSSSLRRSPPLANYAWIASCRVDTSFLAS
jgi:glycine/D-amino acid oxidase-like deaminating enzyme